MRFYCGFKVLFGDINHLSSQPLIMSRQRNRTSHFLSRKRPYFLPD
jgi:hypothetical protein